MSDLRDTIASARADRDTARKAAYDAQTKYVELLRDLANQHGTAAVYDALQVTKQRLHEILKTRKGQ